MPQSTDFQAGEELAFRLVGELPEERAEELFSKYDASALSKVFGDGELLSTCFRLFENDLNVSLTARKLYMHRNTLIYRVNKIRRLTGLNVCRFSDALTFLFLYAAYAKKTSVGGIRS